MSQVETKMCQSCAMPLNSEKDNGKNADGAINEDYCHYCWSEGAFTSEETMEQMIESCVPHVSSNNPFPNAEAARAAMRELFPHLKRWSAVNQA